MRSLFASLNDHPMALLRGIAELRDVELTTNARGDAAAQLASLLAESSATAAALAECSSAGQAAFGALVAAGGRMKAGVFARVHGDIRSIGPGRLERESTWRQPGTPAEELWYRGLIFRAFADFGDGPLEYFYVQKIWVCPPTSFARDHDPESDDLPRGDPPTAAQGTQFPDRGRLHPARRAAGDASRGG